MYLYARRQLTKVGRKPFVHLMNDEEGGSRMVASTGRGNGQQTISNIKKRARNKNNEGTGVRKVKK
jgi:hypothetical protein